LGALGENGGIEGVGLGEPAEGFGEVAHLAGIGDDDRDAGFRECGDGRTFESAGGFEHDERGREREQPRSEFVEAGVVIGDRPRLTAGDRGDVERGCGDVDPDVAVHGSLRAGGDRRGPALRDAGITPGQLFGLSAIERRVAPRLTDGLKTLRQSGLPPQCKIRMIVD
jgi:hypothetical protein